MTLNLKMCSGMDRIWVSVVSKFHSFNVSLQLNFVEICFGNESNFKR